MRRGGGSIDVFEPTIAAVPEALRGRLEPAELFHQVLDHRWYLSEAAGHDVGLGEAVKSFVDTVLPRATPPGLSDIGFEGSSRLRLGVTPGTGAGRRSPSPVAGTDSASARGEVRRKVQAHA